MRIHLHESDVRTLIRSLVRSFSTYSYLCSEPHDTCLDRFFHFAVLFESQYLYVQVDVITVAVVENCFPKVLLDVQEYLASDASMHATIFFSPHQVCVRVFVFAQKSSFFSCFGFVLRWMSASGHVSMKTWTFHPITKWARPNHRMRKYIEKWQRKKKNKH